MSSIVGIPVLQVGSVSIAVPWQGHVVVGTTDIPVASAQLDVSPTSAELNFIVAEVNNIFSAR